MVERNGKFEEFSVEVLLFFIPFCGSYANLGAFSISHGWRSLVGCNPWGHKESDMTEQLHFHFSLLCIGEGNGNPPQCSCLENPRDGVAQSWTRLK